MAMFPLSQRIGLDWMDDGTHMTWILLASTFFIDYIIFKFLEVRTTHPYVQHALKNKWRDLPKIYIYIYITLYKYIYFITL